MNNAISKVLKHGLWSHIKKIQILKFARSLIMSAESKKKKKK